MPAIDRRGFLGGAAALGGCAHCPPFAAGAAALADAPLGDAHAHFFNAADLPIAGFVAHVFIGGMAPWAAPYARALIEQAATVMKLLAKSAREEMNGAVEGAEAERRYPDALADRIDQQLRARGNKAGFAPADDLADSYAALAQAIGLRAPEKSLAAPPPARVDRAALRAIAQDGAAALPADKAVAFGGGLAALYATIKWFGLMTRSRCHHVHRYLQSTAVPGRRMVRAVNLLVDYDKWLDDTPATGSTIEDQLAFWQAFTARAKPPVEIVTFAAYDPLRDAETRLAGGGDAYLRQALGWVATGRARGFKLYPPMGFRAIGNRGRRPYADRSGPTIAARWRREGWDVATFGDRVEDALDGFFAACAERGIPVLAHARHSNGAATGADDDASAAHWIDRADAVFARTGKPLRVTLAHYWHGKGEFPPFVAKALALDNAGRADINFDFSYADEFIDGGADAFVQAIERNFSALDPNGARILFGTDWIMLAREVRADRYTAEVLAAIDRAAIPGSFWARAKENVLHANLDRFLA